MPFRRHSAALSALSALALTATAAAQSVPLPREAQVGPRPFYLVDKMKDGPLKTQLSQCTGPFHKTAFSFGNDPKQLGEYAWFAENAEDLTHEVGKKKPNPWGLYDMHGNVAEWCQDVYDKGYYASSPDKNPRGPAGEKEYVLRGGSWKSSAEGLRSAYRLGETPGFSDA